MSSWRIRQIQNLDVSGGTTVRSSALTSGTVLVSVRAIGGAIRVLPGGSSVNADASSVFVPENELLPISIAPDDTHVAAIRASGSSASQAQILEHGAG